MIFVVKKHRLAEADAAAAAVWYETQSPGLGSSFLDEAEAALFTLAHNAQLYSVRFADVRCLRLQRFKDYGVYYVITRQEVWVLAILHGAREADKLVRARKSNG